MTPDQPSPYGPPFPRAHWPNGPLRPPAATAAGVLGILTGGLTAMVCLFLFVMVVSGYGDAASMLMLVGGAPCAVCTITGGALVLGGHHRGLLLGSASAAVAVLLLALLLGLARGDGEPTLASASMIAWALPFPVVTVAMVTHRSVKGWTEDSRLG